MIPRACVARGLCDAPSVFIAWLNWQRTVPALALAGALGCFTGCSGESKPAAGHESHAHHHEPPHGGTAIDLGDEEAHVEFVLDATAGRLTAYVLKPHMSGFQRLTQEAIELTAQVNGQAVPLTLKAVANSATGEKAGDTAQFEAQADWLKTTKTFDAEMKSITVRGKAFAGVKFNFPKGNEAAPVHK